MIRQAPYNFRCFWGSNDQIFGSFRRKGSNPSRKAAPPRNPRIIRTEALASRTGSLVRTDGRQAGLLKHQKDLARALLEPASNLCRLSYHSDRLLHQLRTDRGRWPLLHPGRRFRYLREVRPGFLVPSGRGDDGSIRAERYGDYPRQERTGLHIRDSRQRPELLLPAGQARRHCRERRVDRRDPEGP